jgi:aerotaxis receptor
MAKPTPRNIESPFNLDEFFFSVTDLKGKIVFGNDVFVRVSKYGVENLIGKPHNIVRHPDMPRAVFKVFWDKLLGGHPVGAYVKNMAADGSYYWVFAFAFPVKEGFLSIRFKPSSPLFDAVKSIYADVLKREETDGMEQAGVLLLQHLRQAGFNDYDHFMRSAAISELQSRDEQIRLHPALESSTRSTSVAKENSSIQSISENTSLAMSGINTSFSKIMELRRASETFSKCTHSMQEGFFTLNTVVLNMIVTAAKYGIRTATLGVVSKEFSRTAGQIEVKLKSFSEFMLQLGEVIERSSLLLAILKTEMLMVDFFVKELLQKATTDKKTTNDMEANRDIFVVLFEDSAKSFADEIRFLAKNLSVVFEQLREIHQLISSLEVIRQAGAIESSRFQDTQEAFAHYLEEMDKFNAELKKSMSTIQKEGGVLVKNLSVASSTVEQISSSVKKIFDLSLSQAS